MVNTLALVLAAALAPGAKDDDLKVSNVRAMYSAYGPVRPDDRLLHRDVYWVTYDTDHVKVAASGKFRLSQALKVINSKGQPVYQRDFENTDGLSSLGGTRIRGFVRLDIGDKDPPGPYTLQVTVKDRAAGKQASFERKFEILSSDFGIIQFQLTNGATVVPPVGVVGQQLVINFGVVGADTAKGKKSPHVKVRLEVLDEDGNPTIKKPMPYESNDLAKDTVIMPWSLYLALNRVGKFTVKLTATDENNKDVKPAELSFPLSVYDLK